MAAIFNFQAVEKVYETALSDISGLITYSTVVAGIGALLFICAKIWKQWANGGEIDFYGLLRPFAILLILLNFSIVPVFIDTLTDPLKSATRELRDSKNEEYNEKWKKLGEFQVDKFKNAADTLTNGDLSLQGIYNKVCQISNLLEYLDPIKQTNYWIKNVTSYAISTGVQYLCTAVSGFIYIFAYLTKIILVIIGPLVFALAIFPGFGNVLQQWFCRYINVCLWIPICNIIGYVMQSIVISVQLDNTIKAAEDGVSLVQQTYITTSNHFPTIILMLISVFLYAMVPKMADWIISGNGSGMFADAIGSAGGKVASMGMSMAGRNIANKGAAKAIGSEVGKQVAKAMGNNNG